MLTPTKTGAPARGPRIGPQPPSTLRSPQFPLSPSRSPRPAPPASPPPAGALATKAEIAAQVQDLSKIERYVEQVLASRTTFRKFVSGHFRRYDADADGRLTEKEARAALQSLIDHLRLPPLTNEAMSVYLGNYLTTSGPWPFTAGAYMSFESFANMYWKILENTKKKFFPERPTRVRRASLIGETDLTHHRRRIEDFFEFHTVLGAGSFGEVYLVAEHRSNLQRVCKVIAKDLSKVPLEQIEAEIHVLKRLDHPHVIKVFEVFSDENFLYIIMEICSGGELATIIEDANRASSLLPANYVAELTYQLLCAVNYFHTCNIAHKDLKPQNVLFQAKTADSPIKIIDFGLAEIFEKQNDSSSNAAGTYLYMAPEVLDFNVSLKCDIWSAGAMLFELLTGTTPFHGDTVKEVERRLRTETPDYAMLRQLRESPQFRADEVDCVEDLLRHMLDKNLRTRWTAAQCLQHKWFARNRLAFANVPRAICRNLQVFRKGSHLRHAVNNVLAHQLDSTSDQMREITAVFKAVDGNSDGLLSLEEVRWALSLAGLGEHEIRKINNALDVDGSGSISYTEFVAAAYAWERASSSVVRSAFNKLDQDRDGRVTYKELRAILVDGMYARGATAAGAGGGASDAELERIFREMDGRGDGVVDWEEFAHFVNSRSAPARP